MYCEVLDQQLQDRKKRITEEKDRIVFQKKQSGSIAKENKSIKKLSHSVSPRSQRNYMNSKELDGKRSCNKADQRRSEISRIVRTFLESDENSSIAPGVKDTITRQNIKKRKRYLCDTIDNTGTQKNRQLFLSYSIFAR